MRWLWPTLAVLVGLLSLGRRASSPRPQPAGPGRWVDADAPRRIRALAERLGWPGLGDFLVAVAYWESRGNSIAGSSAGNAARGWFGMRPQTARVDDLSLEPDALKVEPVAVALAGWLVDRLRPYAAPGQVVDWLAIRRGWYLPSLVDDVAEQHAASRKVREAFEEALAKVGLEASFMHQEVDFSSWPGIAAAMERVA